jgi:hypothetical protein
VPLATRNHTEPVTGNPLKGGGFGILPLIQLSFELLVKVLPVFVPSGARTALSVTVAVTGLQLEAVNLWEYRRKFVMVRPEVPESSSLEPQSSMDWPAVTEPPPPIGKKMESWP